MNVRYLVVAVALVAGTTALAAAKKLASKL
jgi:hypothetical protein